MHARQVDASEQSILALGLMRKVVYAGVVPPRPGKREHTIADVCELLKCKACFGRDVYC